MGYLPAEDWIALLDLVTRYSRALDSKDYVLLRTVFTPECLLTYDFTDLGYAAEILTYRSPDEIIDDVKVIHADLRTLHQNGNYYFDIDGDSAIGRVYCDLYQVRPRDEHPTGVHRLGWYDDVYMKRDGMWFIEQRHWKPTWNEGEWIGGVPERS
jgi:SnoaL-like domain